MHASRVRARAATLRASIRGFAKLWRGPDAVEIGVGPDLPDYRSLAADNIPAENVETIRGLLDDTLKSSLEAQRALLGRVSSLMTFGVTLTSGDVAFLAWLRADSRLDPSVSTLTAAAVPGMLWAYASFACLRGLRAVKLPAPGIVVEDAYTLRVLLLPERKLSLWVLESMAGTIVAGRRPSIWLGRLLDHAIGVTAVAPLFGIVVFALTKLGMSVV